MPHAILSASMKVPFRAASRMTSVILIIVITALCFSAGEGLRLTPFPISALIGLNSDQTVKPADHISKYKYGPLDVPTQHQKSNKRKAASPSVHAESGSRRSDSLAKASQPASPRMLAARSRSSANNAGKSVCKFQ